MGICGLRPIPLAQNNFSNQEFFQDRGLLHIGIFGNSHIPRDKDIFSSLVVFTNFVSNYFDLILMS